MCMTLVRILQSEVFFRFFFFFFCLSRIRDIGPVRDIYIYIYYIIFTIGKISILTTCANCSLAGQTHPTASEGKGLGKCLH